MKQELLFHPLKVFLFSDTVLQDPDLLQPHLPVSSEEYSMILLPISSEMKSEVITATADREGDIIERPRLPGILSVSRY